MSRPVWWIIGLTLVSVVIIWLLALAFGVLPMSVSLGLTMVALITGGAAYYWYRRRLSQRAQALDGALRAQGDAYAQAISPDRRPEVLELRRDFDRAVSSLKASKLSARGRDALYQLPWYAVIGPPGAGKTTALQNSGLHFPQLPGAAQRYRGVAGTRHCDWWLTNEAVLLDTAGRWSVSEDQEEWSAFLDLLRTHRKRKPLNGLLVALSVAELVTLSEEQVLTISKHMRERIEEITSRLGFQLPVYVLLTKADLLPGFLESFSDLGPEQRGQVLGFTVPANDPVQDVEAVFDEQLTALVESLAQRAAARMAEEPSLDRRELIFEFPAQFASLRTCLGAFLGELFRDNVFQHAPLFRGAYFVSGTQVGRPLDQLLQKMGAAFHGIQLAAVPAVHSEPRSFFLRDLFRTVIFPDQHLAAPTARNLRRARLREKVAAAALTLVAFFVTIIPGVSGCRNAALVRHAEALATPAARDPLSDDALEGLRKLVLELRAHQQAGAPLRLRFGMYQGEALYPAVRDAYLARVRKRWVEPFVRRLVTRLAERVPQAVSPDEAFQGLAGGSTARGSHDAVLTAEALKSYRMRYRDLKGYLLLTARGPGVFAHDASERSARGAAADEPPAELWAEASAFLSRWWLKDILAREHLTIGAADAARVDAHLSAFAELFAALDVTSRRRARWEQDAALVALAREPFSRVRPEEASLAEMVLRFERHGFSSADVLPSGMFRAKSPLRVRGVFTDAAWRAGVYDWLRKDDAWRVWEGWVVGDHAYLQRDGEALARLHDLFFRAYVAEWRTFVDGIAGLLPEDRDASLRLLRRSTAGDPTPLQTLFDLVAKHTELALPEPEGDSPEALVAGMVAAAGGRGGDDAGPPAPARALHGMGTASDPWRSAVADPPSTDPRYVRRQFEGFLRFGGGGAVAGGGEPPITLYLEQLRFLRDAFQLFSEDERTGDALLDKLQGARTVIRGLIDEQDVGWRPNFERLLWPVVDGSAESSVLALGARAGRAWCAEVWGPFQHSLSGRYPFDPHGPDASLDDVHDFFAPASGRLWAFYGQSLAHAVPEGGDAFHFASSLGSSSKSVFQESLRAYLGHAKTVTAGFYTWSGPAGSSPSGGRGTEGGSRPSFDFDVRMHPTPGIASLVLEVDGERVIHHNGPERWSRVRWPRPDASQPGAALELRGSGGAFEVVRREGTWGLFRLFELANVRRLPDRHLLLTWRLGASNSTVALELRPVRSSSPLSTRPGAQGLGVLSELRRSGNLPQSIARDQGGCGG